MNCGYSLEPVLIHITINILSKNIYNKNQMEMLFLHPKTNRCAFGAFL